MKILSILVFSVFAYLRPLSLMQWTRPYKTLLQKTLKNMLYPSVCTDSSSIVDDSTWE